MLDVSSFFWWLPLSVLAWAVQWPSFMALGCFSVERPDESQRSFKVRQRLPAQLSRAVARVLFNQVLVLLPAMIAFQYTGLAFTGRPHLSVCYFLAAMALMTIGHDIVQYVFHRFVLHRPGLIRKLGHSVHHSTGASKAIGACYMSPPDLFLEIALPYLVPLAIIGAGADVTFHLTAAGLGAVENSTNIRDMISRFACRGPISRFRLQPLAALPSVTSKAHGDIIAEQYQRRFRLSGILNTILRPVRYGRCGPEVRAPEPLAPSIQSFAGHPVTAAAAIQAGRFCPMSCDESCGVTLDGDFHLLRTAVTGRRRP
jgi:sterol desaturase/sphingolipid hydroxylase (fatty acid hydroxylase superfamily)